MAQSHNSLGMHTVQACPARSLSRLRYSPMALRSIAITLVLSSQGILLGSRLGRFPVFFQKRKEK